MVALVHGRVHAAVIASAAVWKAVAGDSTGCESRSGLMRPKCRLKVISRPGTSAMNLLTKLFGIRAQAVRTAVDRPLKVHDPSIGFLNLCGEAGAQLLETDKRTLGPLFCQTKVRDGLPPPQCDVLFIYCDLSPKGHISEPVALPRDLIKSARAYIAVFASENDPNAYINRMGKRTDWGANIVMVLNRNGDRFAAFFQHLFTAMFAGQSMPMAWVQLVPQGPSPKHNETPTSIFAAEAGHVTFIRTANNRLGGSVNGQC